MNSIKAPRLTEEEVHQAANELKDAGSKISTTEIYKHLGRGSLTTITNFLKTWNQEEKEEAAALPALIALPDDIKKAAEQLAIKVWAEAKKSAEHEIETQREALKQAEANADARTAEAEAFSEEQTKRIESLEKTIEEITIAHQEEIHKLEEEIKNQIKINREQQEKNNDIAKELYEKIAYEQRATAVLEQKNIQLEEKINTLKEKEEIYKKSEEKLKHENARLEIQIHKQQLSLDTITKDRDAEKRCKDTLYLENVKLREKASNLEGELKAWQEIKPKKATAKKADQSKPKDLVEESASDPEAGTGVKTAKTTKQVPLAQ